MPSVRRLVVAGFVLFQVVAITVAAIPAPGDLPAIEPSGFNSQSAVTRLVSPIADDAAVFVVTIAGELWRALGVVRALTGPYVDITAQHQRWHMFSGPLTVNEIVRARYYVARASEPSSRPAWLATQVILPAHPPEWWRLLASFRGSFSDKAISSTLADFRSHTAGSTLRGEEREEFAPVARYFAGQYERRLAPGERIVRTEIWYGRAPIPPGGALAATPDDVTAPTPVAAGIVEQHENFPPYSGLLSREREGPVEWMLVYSSGI